MPRPPEGADEAARTIAGQAGDQPGRSDRAPPGARRRSARYATRLGAVVTLGRSTARTIGALVATPRRRLFLLAVVPLVWIVALQHRAAPADAPDQLATRATRSARPTRRASRSPNYALFFNEPLYFTALPAQPDLLAAGRRRSRWSSSTRSPTTSPRSSGRSGATRALLLLLVPFWAGELIRTFSVIMLLANRGAVNMRAARARADRAPDPDALHLLLAQLRRGLPRSASTCCCRSTRRSRRSRGT